MCHYIRLENRCKALCDLLPLPFPAELPLLLTLSAASLGLTVLGLVLASATAPRATAEFFNLVLALVSAPMYCGNIWALSILLWACLFLASAEVGHHCK